ncbi:DNA internalization-related competence protein ComEC/Rec2 [Staphylococcus massiliensis]|nr:DNA internalization-related competence protein ComEC/Rec2 [Staphylococcus massiliensis]
MFHIALSFLIGALFHYNIYLSITLCLLNGFILLRKSLFKLFGGLSLIAMLGGFYWYTPESHDDSQTTQMLATKSTYTLQFLDEFELKEPNLLTDITYQDEPYKFLIPRKALDKQAIYITYHTCQVEGSFKQNTSQQYKSKGIFIAQNIHFETCKPLPKNVISHINVFRSHIIQRIQAHPHFGSDKIVSLISGSTKTIDSSELDLIRQLGIYHLFAVSGTHVGLFCLCVRYIMLRLNIPIIYINIALVVLLPSYAIFTGMQPSAIRAVSMCLILLFLPKVCRPYLLEILSVLFICICLINKEILFHLGFQFSYLITCFLILSKTFLSQLSRFQQLISITAIAQFGAMIISIYAFNEVQWIGLISNIVFVPLYSIIILPFVFLYFLIVLTFGQAPFLITFIASWLFRLQDILLRLFEPLTRFKWHVQDLTPLYLCITFILVLTIFVCFTHKKPKAAIVCLLTLILCLKFIFIFHGTKLTFIDVGQGDSTLFETKKHHYIMIDTGGLEHEHSSRKSSKSITERNTYPLLKRHGITHLDHLIITHPHKDHYGEIENLLQKVPIKHVIINKGSFEPSLLQAFETLSKTYRFQLTDVKSMNQLQVDEVEFNFLDGYIDTSDDPNEHSIVVLANINQYRLLFMGDATARNEEKLLNQYDLPHIDIFKVGHHGSKTSSSPKFIETIHPTFSVISSGKNNVYRLPNKEVVSRLLQHQTILYDTQKHEHVVFELGDQLQIYQESVR